MKTFRIALMAFLLALAARATAAEVLTVAVFNFDTKDEAIRDLGPKIADLVSTYLSADPQIVTVERAELDKILGEHELGLSGTVAPGSEAKVGQLTGAKVLVTGRAFTVDKQMTIIAKIIGTETSVVFGAVVQGNSGRPITELSEELAKKIGESVAQKGDKLVAKVPTREERVAKIKLSLKDKKLPAVSVRIGERHFGQPVIDPAAETELGLILQECGFTLVDDKSTNKPDVQITGDAFSAYALRKGNLISCKARVELKAQKTTGEVIAVDRQTSVAVDITEQTSAKTALQNAGADLAERILPKLGL